MKVIIDVSISLNNHYFDTLRKEYETQVVPNAGMGYEDSAWHEPRPIRSVTINLDEGYYFVDIDGDHFLGQTEAQQQVQMYQSHGWIRVADVKI